MLTAVVVVLVVVFLVQYLRGSAAKNLPPGPWSPPILGNGPVELPKDVVEYRRKYGDIFRTRTGSVDNVVLCNYKLIKEAMSKVELTDRPHWKGLNVVTEGRQAGITFSSGHHWHTLRRFLLRNLRDLGMGKSYMDDAIQVEAEALVKHFKNFEGKPVTMSSVLNMAPLNVAWQLVTRKRYELNDPVMTEFVDLVAEFESKFLAPVLPEFYPILKLLPNFLLDKLTNKNEILEMNKKIQEIIGEIIESHRKTLDPANPRDVIDEYLIEMNKGSDTSATFSEEDLIKTVFDLFVAAYETTSNTLRWFLLYMAAHPEVQRRVQHELDSVVSRDVLICYEHRSQLPYLNAVIHEVHRRSSMLPMSVFHAASHDSQVGGYTIPKGTVVHCVTEMCHMDPHYWLDPQSFNPDRFLDHQGNFVPPRESFMPFGIGRRQCLGEALARMELLIFSAALLQNFTFSPPPNSPLEFEPEVFPLTNFPKVQDIVATFRQ